MYRGSKLFMIISIIVLLFGNFSIVVSGAETEMTEQKSTSESTSQSQEQGTSASSVDKGSVIESSEKLIEEATTAETESQEEVKESEETTEETTEEQEQPAGISIAAADATIDGDGQTEEKPLIVNNSEELRDAIETKRVPYIKLADSTEVFDIRYGTRRHYIYKDISIDGNGRTITYDGMYAFYASVANLKIKFENIIFGSPDFDIPVNDYWGICYSPHRNTSIHVENIKYYSNRGSQPFYNPYYESKLVFSGSNYFDINKSGGYNNHEFAECSNFIFEEDSHTTVIQDGTTGQAINVHAYDPFSFTLKKNAVVDFDTKSTNFVLSTLNDAKINLEENSSFKLNADTNFTYYSLRYQINVQERANLDLTVANPFNFANTSTFNFNKDSLLNLSVTNGSQIFSIAQKAANFIVNNAYRLTFSISKNSNSEPLNTGLTFSSFLEDGQAYGITANNQSLSNFIQSNDIITSNNKNLSIKNDIQRDDFTAEEKTLINTSTHLVFQRLPNPAVISEVGKTVRDSEAEFYLADYLSNNNTLTNVEYRLYNTKKVLENDGKILLDDEQNLISAEQIEESPWTEKITFDELNIETDYWLYVQIRTEIDSGYSEWMEVPFTTKSSNISVSVPMTMFFSTGKDEETKTIVSSQNYNVKNNSAFKINVVLSNFLLDEKNTVNLLEEFNGEAEIKPSEGLVLNLLSNGEKLTLLTSDVKNIEIGNLDTDEQSNLRFSGQYFGFSGIREEVNYTMTLSFNRVGAGE